MSNIIINNSSYTLTSSIDKPRIKVSNSYIPLTTKDNNAKVYIVSNNSKYNIMSYSTSSSSSSTIETTGYSGISSRQSYYYTTSNAPGYMSSITNLTRASTSGTNYGTKNDTKTIYTEIQNIDIKEISKYYNSGTTRNVRDYYNSLSITATYTYANKNYIYLIGTFSAIGQGTTSESTAINGYGGDYTRWTYNGTSTGIEGKYFATVNTRFADSSESGTLSYTNSYSAAVIITTGTTYLTRESISGYATRSSISGYATRSSVSGYAGSLSRQSDYLTSSTSPGSMSNITYLTSSASESSSTTTWV